MWDALSWRPITDRITPPIRHPRQHRSCSRPATYPTARFHREALAPGCSIDGPAIVEEATATTVIPPEGSATIDEYGCLVIGAPPA